MPIMRNHNHNKHIFEECKMYLKKKEDKIWTIIHSKANGRGSEYHVPPSKRHCHQDKNSGLARL